MTATTRKKRLLVALSGLSPQVVTETVYALAVGTPSPWLPDQVHLITTVHGAQRAREYLLGPHSRLSALCFDYQLPQPEFAESHIHVIGNPGSPLDDIRTSAENAAAADAISSLIRNFTADPDTEIALSLAGGRKTMGFLAGAALTLFGRIQDRLLHVLVYPPELESNPSFFYPTRVSTPVAPIPPGSVCLDASAARVTLAEIPFIRVREWVPAAVLEGSPGWFDSVAATQGRLGHPSLVLFPAERCLQASHQPVTLPPAEFAFYLWHARRAAEALPFLPAPTGPAGLTCSAAYLEAYFQCGGSSLSTTAATLRRHGMSRWFFNERYSRVNKILRTSLGIASSPFLIQSKGRRPNTIYGLALPKDAIAIRW